MRISDWSSDVCSSDLALHGRSREPASCIAVITPTVALALDHARTLSTVPGLERSRALTGDLKGRDRDDLLNEFRRGEIPILLLSPEIALGAARDVLLAAATPPGAKYARRTAQRQETRRVGQGWVRQR